VFSYTLRPVFLTIEGTFTLWSLLAACTPGSPNPRDLFLAEHSFVKYTHCEMSITVTCSVNRAVQGEAFYNLALTGGQFLSLLSSLSTQQSLYSAVSLLSSLFTQQSLFSAVSLLSSLFTQQSLCSAVSLLSSLFTQQSLRSLRIYFVFKFIINVLLFSNVFF
jgi:hypothetical protein